MRQERIGVSGIPEFVRKSRILIFGKKRRNVRQHPKSKFMANTRKQSHIILIAVEKNPMIIDNDIKCKEVGHD